MGKKCHIKPRISWVLGVPQQLISPSPTTCPTSQMHSRRITPQLNTQNTSGVGRESRQHRTPARSRGHPPGEEDQDRYSKNARHYPPPRGGFYDYFYAVSETVNDDRSRRGMDDTQRIASHLRSPVVNRGAEPKQWDTGPAQDAFPAKARPRCRSATESSIDFYGPRSRSSSSSNSDRITIIRPKIRPQVCISSIILQG